MQIVVATGARTGKDHAIARAAEIARVHNARLRVLPSDDGPGWVVATPEQIADRSDRPVLVIHRPMRRPYAQVLVCLDERTDVRRALETTRFVAPSASVSLLHAYEGIYETALLLDGASARRLQQYLRDVRRETWAALSRKIEDAGGDPGALLLRRGSPRRVVLREERRRRANDTLFVLERRRSLIRHWIFGSVSQALVREGRSDVLVV